MRVVIKDTRKLFEPVDGFAYAAEYSSSPDGSSHFGQAPHRIALAHDLLFNWCEDQIDEHRQIWRMVRKQRVIYFAQEQHMTLLRLFWHNRTVPDPVV